jgi:pimeloyl-ACP methyl ester carboxylesterase
MMAQDAKNLMDFLNIESAHLVGLSMGGMIAQEFAITFPERVKSLVIAASTSNGHAIQSGYFETVNRWVKNNVNIETRIEELLPFQFTKKFLSNHETYNAIKELMLKDRFPQPLYALSQQVDAAYNFDSQDRIEKIKAPTLILVGDEDINTPATLSEQLKEQIPNSQLCIIGGSHGFNIENTAMFNNAIMEFLCNLEEL